MSKTVDEIIKEAELQVISDTAVGLEKKASDLVTELLEKRKEAGLDKVAETTIEQPVIKTFEKIAIDFKTVLNAGRTLGKDILANKGASNMLKGAIGGAATGALASKDGERASGAIKGGLLGGIAGAGVSAFTKPTLVSKTLKGNISSVSPIKQFTNNIGTTTPTSLKAANRFTGSKIPTPTTTPLPTGSFANVQPPASPNVKRFKFRNAGTFAATSTPIK